MLSVRACSFSMVELVMFFVLCGIVGPSPSSSPSYHCNLSTVSLGDTVSCDCYTPLDWGESGRAYWNSTGSQNLQVSSVTKQDNGREFICLAIAADGSEKTATYTLQVGYGPDSNCATISAVPSAYTTEDATNEVLLRLTCHCDDVNPSPDYTWFGAPCKNNCTACNTNSTCTFVPKLLDEGTEVTCRVRDSAGAKPPRESQTNYTIVFSDAASQTTHTTAHDNGVSGVTGGSTVGPSNTDTTTGRGVAVIKGSLHTVMAFVISLFVAFPV